MSNIISAVTALFLVVTMIYTTKIEQDLNRTKKIVNRITQQVIVLSIEKLAKDQDER